MKAEKKKKKEITVNSCLGLIFTAKMNLLEINFVVSVSSQSQFPDINI